MRNTEKFSLVLKLGHQNSRTVDGLSELSYPGWTGGFYLLMFCSFTSSTNAKPTFLVVRESLRPMKDLSENLSSSPPSLLAECLCGIKLVFLVGMTAGSEIGAEQRVRTAGGLVRCVLPSGMGTVTTCSSPGSKRKAIKSRSGCIFQKFCPHHSRWVSSFQTQSIEEGRRGGSVPPQTSQSCAPPCQVSACHVCPCSLLWDR